MAAALVTGGASGLGHALVRLLRAKGWDVAILDLNAEFGAQVAEDTGSVFIQCDVGDRAAWSESAAQIARDMRPLKKVFLNAGVMSRPASASLFDDIIPWLNGGAYERVMRVNVEGALYGMVETAPLLAANGGGTITVTASVAGLEGFAPDPLYSMSKHAVVGLVRSFGPIFAAEGVCLAAFCPGGIATPLVPHELAKGGFAFLKPEEAAQSCWEVSEQAGAGSVWIQPDAATSVRPYQSTPAFRD